MKLNRRSLGLASLAALIAPMPKKRLYSPLTVTKSGSLAYGKVNQGPVYYGGREEYYRPGTTIINYDISSAYPLELTRKT